MTKAKLLLGCICLAVLGAGCGSSGPQELDANYLQNAEELGKARKVIFDRAGGDWEKLSEADRAEFQKGMPDETAAKKMWEVMKSGPPSAGPTAP